MIPTDIIKQIKKELSYSRKILIITHKNFTPVKVEFLITAQRETKPLIFLQLHCPDF